MNPVAIYPYKEDPEIRKMRVQAWFRAVSLASGLTPRELEKKYSESGSAEKGKRSCVWDKYRRGEVVPRSGLRPDGGLNLVDRVERNYSKTAEWLTLPLWRLLDKAPMEMSEIRRCYESLPVLLQSIFIEDLNTGNGIFWRKDFDCEDACEILLRFANLDGFSAVLTMLREAESSQNIIQYEICLENIGIYARRLEHDDLVKEASRKLHLY